ISNIGSSGTIANSSGPIDLSQLSNLNFNGHDIAILSATDIINSGGVPLSINLSNASGAGGNLLFISGFAFDPSTGGSTQGPDMTPYTLLSGSIAGGSINLGNISIITSGSTGGGTVTIVANKGNSSIGSIAIGTITTRGGSGSGGSVTMLGNG